MVLDFVLILFVGDSLLFGEKRNARIFRLVALVHVSPLF